MRDEEELVIAILVFVFFVQLFQKEPAKKKLSKAPKPDNLSSDAKPCWSCENYGCRKNCFEDSEIQNCKNTNSTDIFDMPLLLTYFVFAQQKRLQSSVTQKWEI